MEVWIGSEDENGRPIGSSWNEVRNNRGEKRKKRSDVEEFDGKNRKNVKCIVRLGEQYGVSRIKVDKDYK